VIATNKHLKLKLLEEPFALAHLIYFFQPDLGLLLSLAFKRKFSA
jgi:hypothetical protein